MVGASPKVYHMLHEGRTEGRWGILNFPTYFAKAGERKMLVWIDTSENSQFSALKPAMLYTNAAL